jgi:hypothetical protein
MNKLDDIEKIDNLNEVNKYIVNKLNLYKKIEKI